MQTFAYDYGTYFEIIVTDGSEQNSFTFDFNKLQDLQVSINESLELANFYVSQNNFVPKGV